MTPLYRLLLSHGPLQGRLALSLGIAGFALAVLSLLAVLAFHFPEYLTTPELRRRYDVEWLRRLLLAALVVSGALALLQLLLGRVRWLAGATFALVLVSAALGGHAVPVDPDFPDHTPYIGLDFLVLDLLGSALLFVFIEKARPLRPQQPVFREAWQTDLAHFAVIHLLVGLLMLATNGFAHRVVAWAEADVLQATVQALPFPVALLAAALVADLVQYGAHRCFHEVPWLWRFHAVHHSVRTMDWLAGSRLHLFEVLVTRSLVLAALLLAGFTRGVIDAYIVIVGFHAVLNHANVNLRLGPLRHLLVTPAYHHWHHASEAAAIDRNYAAHFPFIDLLFGTQVRGAPDWPTRYGVVEDDVPDGFWAQTLHPFRKTERTGG
jgi:sterol desaturase/sphingolipid hydroxylase (fatty acid hydroxylase superfamily)